MSRLSLCGPDELATCPNPWREAASQGPEQEQTRTENGWMFYSFSLQNSNKTRRIQKKNGRNTVLTEKTDFL